MQIKALEKLFAQQREDEHLEVLKQAIYVVCNLASPGVEMHKNAALASAIPPHLLYYMVCIFIHIESLLFVLVFLFHLLIMPKRTTRVRQ